ncbi:MULTISPECIES: bifunctional metallophosphatase/5'-nucleotidase [unclassified Aureimonas]|uniref:bifunctional metallophosphatase/5'-nucleotidase n=1 Tax=unclassified Aureimonas TaxID=2615206 RepID=UPI0006F58303|nr:MULTISPECIES: 5'-nucleotidase C-terminal domain-containing protein [unclassified Aureimonas]KQT64431.1 multifunctional 2',3'-cyclic-nucleotide 2'-phosphodiesterase/5'-nucleotidase/3'-nucleotidase [Aureimonas sp. Leaf427]KQT81620.1 multifunctional 2',3'-cyclic-nucleotide 2'-phosphodiesterase/5'-nucleotidase/3'-nucleotidase [Aureimonas sp. Leaf460]
MHPALRRLAASLGFLAASTGLASAEYRLTILHTNDVHSRLEPINKTDSTCGEKDLAAKACFGGAARLAAAVAEARASAANTLLVDAGDQFQGSLFYTFYKGREVAELMGRLGYEAMAVGNHEFDDGVPVLERFAEAVPFPVLMANADLTREPKLRALIERTTVIEKGGERIGLIGLTPEANGTLTQAGRTIAFEAPIEPVREAVKALTADGVTKIVLLSHSGYAEDQRIAAAVDGIDVIVGGHSHTLLANTLPGASGPYPTLVASPDGSAVRIVQAGSYGKYLGRLDVTFDDAGRVTEATGEPRLLDAAVPEDEGVKARVAELAGPLEALKTKVVAQAASVIDGARESCRVRECAMGDLVADAMLARVSDQGVEIAITNGGGLRASIDAGPVTMGEVLTVLPFQNTLSTFELSGADVIAALENGVSEVEEGGGRFPQVAGIEVDWSPAGTKGRDRIRAVRLLKDGKATPLDPAATYLVVSNNFMRGGGDGYAVFAEKGQNAYDYGPTLDAVLVDHLVASGSAFVPSTDGRIRQVD